jgi:hypothetical protein
MVHLLRANCDYSTLIGMALQRGIFVGVEDWRIGGPAAGEALCPREDNAANVPRPRPRACGEAPTSPGEFVAGYESRAAPVSRLGGATTLSPVLDEVRAAARGEESPGLERLAKKYGAAVTLLVASLGALAAGRPAQASVPEAAARRAFGGRRPTFSPSRGPR